MVLTIQEMDDLDLNGVQNKEQMAQITTEGAWFEFQNVLENSVESTCLSMCGSGNLR